MAEIKVLALDLDGTLTNNAKVITPRTKAALQAQQDAAGTADSADDDAASQRVTEAQAAYDAAAAELAALQPAEETDGNTEPAADSAEEPQSEPDSANGENAG